MKNSYGVLFYRGTSNIGDDIQLLAAKRFLPQVDYIIEREALDQFVSKNNEKVKVIMNGWFFHQAEHWPPTPFIEPKLLSMHFTDNMMISGWTSKVEWEKVLQINEADFFKENGPVGCRDHHTEQMMKKLDIPCYFSSCLTTTLSLGIKKDIKNIIYAVDVDPEVVDYVKAHSNAEVISLTHTMTKEECEAPVEIRLKRAEELLEKYHQAKMVITSRLHVALPCLGLETPVLLIEHDDPLYKGRLETYYDFVHTTTVDNLLSGKSLYNFDKPKKNPKKYLKYRKKLIDECEQFVQQKPLKKVSDKEYIAWLEKTRENQKEILVKTIVDQYQRMQNNEKNCFKLQTELDRIYYSRSYQMTEKFKKILGRKGE